MKYVMLGHLGPQWITRHEERVDRVMAKFAELGITLETVYYTQGRYDFIDIVETPSAEALLAFAAWYSHEGLGHVESMPAFGTEALAEAVSRLSS